MLEDGHGSQGHGAQKDTCLGQLAAFSDFYFKLSGRAGSGRGAPAAAGGQPGVSKPPKLLGLKISPVSRDERLHG